MSLLQFSESTDKTGMYELFQDLTKTNSTTYTAYKFARDANNALADYFINLAIPASGRWQIDDTNQTDYPELKINLVSGQFDYPLTTDASSTPNQILSIEKLEMCTDTSGSADKFVTLPTYDEMTDTDNLNSDRSIVNILPFQSSIVQRRNVTGTPTRYSKRANGIFLDPTPNYSCTNGLRIFFSRTPSYFVGTDTTKVAGIPDAHQEYLVYRSAYLYCVTNLPQLANGYLVMVQKMERQIKDYYIFRNRDERTRATSKRINFR